MKTRRDVAEMFEADAVANPMGDAQEKFDEVLSLRKRSKARRNAQKQLVTGNLYLRGYFLRSIAGAGDYLRGLGGPVAESALLNADEPLYAVMWGRCKSPVLGSSQVDFTCRRRKRGAR